MQAALQRQVGVTDMDVNISTNWVVIRPQRDRYIPLERIPAALRRAGYKAANLQIEVEGAVESEGGVAMYRIRGWPHAYPLDGPPLDPDSLKSPHWLGVEVQKDGVRLRTSPQP